MQRYRHGDLWLVLFVVAYPTIAGGVHVLQRDQEINEIYPIAPWALFCFTPNDEVDYGIRLLAIDGRTLKKPIYFEDHIALPDANKIIAYAAIQQMGHVADQALADELAQGRERFERNYWLSTHQQVQYELVKRRFDVLERHHEGTFREESVLGNFVFTAEGPER